MQKIINTAGMHAVPIPKGQEHLTLEEFISNGSVAEVEQFCKKHHTSYLSKPFLKASWGEILFSECPLCAKDREERLKAEEEEQNQKNRERAEKWLEYELKNRGCGKKYLIQRKILDNNVGLMSKVKDFLENDGSNFKENKNLIVLGGVGIGKTFFAYKMVEVALGLGLRYIYANSFELVGLYKSKVINGFNRTNSFENLQEFLDGVDCLIVDEIDYFIKGTNDARDEETLHHLAQICEKEDIRLVLLGNCNREELKNALSPKIYSRVSGGKVINGWGIEDLRRAK